MNLINETINGYKFISFINKGSFGAVYKVEKANCFYAIKVFLEDYVLQEFRKSKDKENRLQREINIMKLVKHKYLVQYVDDFIVTHETGENYFLVMEFIEGHNLRTLLTTGPLSENHALNIFIMILKGLDYLHNSKSDSDDVGIIHRDLKPENIIVCANGDIKIVDFGISKVIDFTSITSTGEVLGTWSYMSPEQVTDSKYIDKRSDFYTAGVILYEMLTGSLPYNFQNLPELINKIKMEPSIPPRRKNPKIANNIENIILKLLEKLPYKRFFKTQDIEHELNLSQNPIKIKEYDLSPRFILRLYNEKTVLEKYAGRNTEFGYVEFPANLENNQNGLKTVIQNNANIKIIVDPATIRLAYDTYTDVKGLNQLPYAPNDFSVISPTNLESYTDQKIYVQKVLDKEIELRAHVLLSPFHYTHNSSLTYGTSRNPIAEWFDLDCKLAKESIDYRNIVCPTKDIYTGICIKADILKDEREKNILLNTFSSFDCDGFLIYADNIDYTTNEITLYHYIDFLVKLQNWTKKPVIAGRIAAGLGFGLLSTGIAGFTSGTARFENFSEDLYIEKRQAFNLYTRYFFPELLTTVSIERRNPNKYEEIIRTINKCNCFYCSSKKTLPEVVVDENTKLHFLEVVNHEVDQIKLTPKPERIPKYLRKIHQAQENYKKLNTVFKKDSYTFLARWQKVFTKLMEEQNV